jgi:hypothetical protein
MKSHSQASEILFLMRDLEKLKYCTWRFSVSELDFSSGTVNIQINHILDLVFAAAENINMANGNQHKDFGHDVGIC